MAQLTSQILLTRETQFGDLSQERQRFKRVKLTLLGRFLRENRQEYPCETIDLSPGAIAVKSYEPVYPSERIVLYLDQLGRMEGVVSRVFDGGFAIEISSNRAKREKAAEILTWLINRDLLNLPEDRRHDRVVPQYTYGEFTLPNGRIVRVNLLDVSLSGASVAMGNRIPLGEEVALGGVPARVVRHHDEGIGIEFYQVQNSAVLKRYFR